eukprot:312658_1
MTVFPNIETITIGGGMDFLKKNIMYESVLEFVKKNPETNLKLIMLPFPKEHAHEMFHLIEPYQYQFLQWSWWFYIHVLNENDYIGNMHRATLTWKKM